MEETSLLYDRCATFHHHVSIEYPLIFSWLIQRGIAFIPSHNSLACKITFFQLFAHMLLEIRTSKNACTRGAKVLFKAKILSLRTDALYIFICFIFSSSLCDVFELECNFCWETPSERQLWILASGNDKSIRYTQSDLKGMFWFSGWRCTICFDGEALDSLCTVPLSEINAQKKKLFYIKGRNKLNFFDSKVK